MYRHRRLVCSPHESRAVRSLSSTLSLPTRARSNMARKPHVSRNLTPVDSHLGFFPISALPRLHVSPVQRGKRLSRLGANTESLGVGYTLYGLMVITKLSTKIGWTNLYSTKTVWDYFFPCTLTKTLYYQDWKFLPLRLLKHARDNNSK